MNDYLVRWGNFIILNINLQLRGLGKKLKKKNLGDQDVSFVLFLHAKEPSTIFLCQNWSIEFADEKL